MAQYLTGWLWPNDFFLMNSSNDNRRMEKILHNELRVWRQLRHPHILPLYGTTSFGPRIAMVCPWKEGGNLSKFLGENVALGPIKRYQIRNQLLGILSGLLYRTFSLLCCPPSAINGV
ncbi:hypothetical protein BD779DRAFT_1468994 [Infundibulicybe gibba]|nr:hypothetical protein BD779DRAFT_1468994 [Infundibulicybe gibba]